MEKDDRTIIKYNNVVLLEEDTNFEGISEAISSIISDNPMIKWAKLIITDDMPNENKQRIPQSEFPNLIRSGTYMPLKMAYSEIKDGHEESYPLGVIAHLKQSGNQIVALAALWIRERENDITYLKECIAEKRPVNISWEILHENSNMTEDGIEELIGTSLRAVTVVGKPAYSGRTPILEIASVDNGGNDTNSEENKLDDIETLKTRVTELETALAQKTNELDAKIKEIEAKDIEIASLTEFKTGIEAKEQEAAKIEEIKTLFSGAGIEKPDTYFEENKTKLLTMDKESLSFMVQEMVAFSSGQQSSESSTKVPDVPGKKIKKEIDIAELAKELRKGK